MWSDVARCDKFLRRLDTKFKVVVDITFPSKIGDKVWWGVIRRDEMIRDMITF